MPAVVTLPEVKSALNKKLSTDDGELTRLIDAAEALYARKVRPLPGARTVRLSGGAREYPLPGASSVDSATYGVGGPAIDLTGIDFDPDSEVVYAPRWVGGTRNVVLTYTAGPLPLHHREAIIADVAGLWTSTQRGGGPARPSFGGEGFAEPVEGARGPVVLFPRIEALAPPVFS